MSSIIYPYVPINSIYFVNCNSKIYTKKKLTRKSQERNGDLLGDYIGCKKPEKKIE